MKLFAGRAPNAFRVLAFIVEKHIDLEVEQLDVLKGEARTDTHLKRNSLGEIPVLELDDGSFLSESIAICRYLESIFPDIPLMGSNPLDVARVEMWNRRMEQQIMGPYAQLGLHTLPMFADKVEQVSAYAETQQRRIVKNWEWLETELSDGRDFICGDDFTVADITGMTAMMIGSFINVDIPGTLPRVQRWKSLVQSRPCWTN